MCKHREVIAVHFRYQQGDVLVHPVRTGVAEHTIPRAGELLLDLHRFAGWQR